MKKIIIFILLMQVMLGCKKQDAWLDAKSNKSDVIPSTLEDFQALLDNNAVMNTNYPSNGIVGADNSFVLDATALTAGQVNERNAYKWSRDIYENSLDGGAHWQYPYQTIEYANVVLDGLAKAEISANASFNNIKGQALFFRAFAYYSLLQIYAKQYSKETASTDLGLPLKVSSDVNIVVGRSSVQAVYDQIINDLTLAEHILNDVPLFKTRPSRPAAQSLLAKVYLNMGNYAKAKEYADQVLSSNSSLIDLNTLNAALTYPFPTFQSNNNTEILFYATAVGLSFNSLTNLLVVDELYNQYDANDLRKTIFFRTNANSTRSFRGRYSAGTVIFCGLTTNEVYLIRAECLARLGNYQSAMADINTLLRQRWKKDNGVSRYVNQTASNENDALNIILSERRKELPFNGSIRWEDLKRLNSDPRFAKTLSRTINGQQYTLPPNDNRYVYPIPLNETNFNPLIIQNER
ncbi:RagB/SusD family nutrient uptake outer membrane protein [Pedobacter sp. KLB.chiD]|uniref:RagB/SusD family nutrient uptake outer membrane protein n=1 Tax=Pedobacter sp. KLB.chiD TaxID=3387402 RepID=UPI00399AD526